MQIEINELELSEIGGRSAAELENYRGNKPVLLVTRFEHCPMVAGLLLASKNHVLGMIPEGGEAWVGWRIDANKSAAIRQAFLAELKEKKVDVRRVPRGLFAYQGDVDGDPIEFGTRVTAMTDLWSWPLLMPSHKSALQAASTYLERALQQMGEFMQKPFSDSEATAGRLGQLCSRSSTDKHCLLFFGEGFHSSATQESRVDRLHSIEKLLEVAVADCERGNILNPNELSPAFVYGRAVSFPVQLIAMSDSTESVILERICSLRARLIRILGWPLFWYRLRNEFGAIKNVCGRSQSRIPYNTVGEVEGYLTECTKRNPILEEDPMAEIVVR